MKKYKGKLMDSGQAAVAGALLLGKRSQLIIAISLPLCVFLLSQLVEFRAQATDTQLHQRSSSHRHQSSVEIEPHERARSQLHESPSCLHPGSAPLTRHRRNWRQFGLSRRQALESVVNRLHILESLDEQLRAFSEAAELAQKQQQAAAIEAQSDADQLESSKAVVHLTSGHILCQLTLFRGPATEAAGPASSCLANKRLLNQIPPYMLNLYRQLLVEQHQQQEERARNQTTGESVQSMMPYQAQIMRSFRQPQISLPTHLAGRSNWPDEHYDRSMGELSSKAVQFGGAAGPNVVVELSALEPRPAEPLGGEQDESHWSWPFASANTEAPFKWRHSTAAEAQQGRRRRRRHRQRQQQQPKAAPSEPVCDLRQRLMDASRRDEICFWFNLSENFRMRANKSLEFGLKSTPGDRNQSAGPAHETLVEAELHVFKLFPQLASAASQSLESINRSTSANLFHLKTNLLEVSLYQILPRRRTTYASSRRADQPNQRPPPPPAGQDQKEWDEFPLRLLDIRRIDLNSNGWETFYVKRAVEDWLRDARLNLGLVIKAKSMFDEPIKVGLIRFADAYDHCCQRPDARRGSHLIEAAEGAERSAGEKVVPPGGRGQAKQHEESLRDFDTSHQPLLVIYTTSGVAPPDR